MVIMWFLLYALPVLAFHYVCTSPLNGPIHYYAPNSIHTIPTHRIGDGRCVKECSPCLWSYQYKFMIGYRSICTPSDTDVAVYKLVNFSRMFDTVYPLPREMKPGIYHSYGVNSFTSHTYLCVYPKYDIEEEFNTDFEEEFPPIEISNNKLSPFPYSRFDIEKKQPIYI